MSKNMEEEYRKWIAKETPDLWECIESELPEKRKRRVWRSGSVRFAAGAAAAVAIICIAFPVVRIGSEQRQGIGVASDRDGQPERDDTPEESSGKDGMPENAPVVEEYASAGRGETDAPTEVNFGAGNAGEGAESPAETEMGEPDGGEESVEVAEGETDMDDTSEADKGILMASAEREHEDVPVSVTDVRTVNGEKIYTARVLKNTGTGLVKGDEIVLKGDTIEETLKEGGEYSVSFTAENTLSAQTVSGNEAEIYSLSKVKENEKAGE